jgi:hypothetical protein
MVTNELLQSARVVSVGEDAPGEGDAPYTVTITEGMPVALNGEAPITVRIDDPERDLPRLVQAAERLLPARRGAPGVVALTEAGKVLGVAPRAALEEAVLLRRAHNYPELARTLGLSGSYRPPAGDPAAPFPYWACPECDHIAIPAPGCENDPPPSCPRHAPPVPMVLRIHSGR